MTDATGLVAAQLRWGGCYDADDVADEITYDHLYEMATSALAALDVVTAAIKDPS